MSDAVIDTCCLINICAVDDHRQWLPSLGLRWHLPRAVYAETSYLFDTDDEGNRIKRPLDLQSLIDGDVLAICSADADREKRRYVELARELEDGEAMALAIAECRGWLLATDDRKVRRLAGERSVTVITTPDIIKRWADKASPPDVRLVTALQNIRDRARFLPARNVPLYNWWMSYLAGKS